jgi:hypothetical protein
MQTHLLYTEINPFHHPERLPFPASYPFEQSGNLSFMNLRFPGNASE